MQNNAFMHCYVTVKNKFIYILLLQQMQKVTIFRNESCLSKGTKMLKLKWRYAKTKNIMFRKHLWSQQSFKMLLGKSKLPLYNCFRGSFTIKYSTCKVSNLVTYKFSFYFYIQSSNLTWVSPTRTFMQLLLN